MDLNDLENYKMLSSEDFEVIIPSLKYSKLILDTDSESSKGASFEYFLPTRLVISRTKQKKLFDQRKVRDFGHQIFVRKVRWLSE